jgi:hypothetical protein
VRDPVTLRIELTRRERSYLRAHSAMLDPGYAAWTSVPSAEDGAIALGILGAVD